MNSRNCPNCGAPYQIDLNQCPYCGTSYFDMSAIDFTNGEPFYLKFKMDFNGQECYVTQLVKPHVVSMEAHTETVDMTDCFGSTISSVCVSKGLTTNIAFEAIQDYKRKELFTIEVH